MTQFDSLVKEFQGITPFRIRFKDESWEMQSMYVFIWWFCPKFLTSFTTVIGSTIYFPSRDYIRHNESAAMRTLAHEFVHILDAERWSEPVFMFSYLFPQIFALGVFTFPFFQYFSLLFLLFLLPFPAPFRFYFESRAYALDVLTGAGSAKIDSIEKYASQGKSWSYYLMFPFTILGQEIIHRWVDSAEKGKDPIILKVLLVYEMVKDS